MKRSFPALLASGVGLFGLSLAALAADPAPPADPAPMPAPISPVPPESAATRPPAPMSPAAYVPTLAEKAFPNTEPVAPGKFQPTWDSLHQYQFPEWFRDAKFGIWAHWGPQCQPEEGDWYARNMYSQYDRKGKPNSDYVYHVAHYGHPPSSASRTSSRSWKAENWDPATPAGPVQSSRGQVLHGAGQPPRQLRHLGQQVPALERHQDRPAQRPDRRLGQGRARRRAALRRQRPRRPRLGLERPVEGRRQGPAHWRACPTTAT